MLDTNRYRHMYLKQSVKRVKVNVLVVQNAAFLGHFFYRRCAQCLNTVKLMSETVIDCCSVATTSEPGVGEVSSFADDV